MHVETEGAAVDLRGAHLHQLEQVVVEPALPEIGLDTPDGVDRVGCDVEGAQAFSRHDSLSDVPWAARLAQASGGPKADRLRAFTPAGGLYLGSGAGGEVIQMPEAKLAPNLPAWMREHAERYIASGGADGHMYRMKQPGRPAMTVPSLLLTTTGRKSRRAVHLPAVLRQGREQLHRRRLQGRRARASRLVPQHPRRPRCRGPGRHDEAEGARQDRDRRGAGEALGRRRWSSGRPMRTISRRRRARSPSSCSIRCRGAHLCTQRLPEPAEVCT